MLKTGESQRKNGTYSFRWTDDLGIRHDVYAPTLEQLRQKEQEIRKNERNNGKAQGRNITVDALYRIWLSLKQNLRATSRDNYCSLYENHIKQPFGNRRAQSIKKSEIQSFYHLLFTQEGIEANTIFCIHNIFRQILNIGVDDGYLVKNPCHRALTEIKRAAQGGKKQRPSLSIAEQKRFLSYLNTDERSRRYRPVFTTILCTGMRAGEIGALQWSDIDWDKNCITINHTLTCCSSSQGWELHLHAPKTPASQRKIQMIPAVRSALEEERAYHREHNLRCTTAVDGLCDFVFLTNKGTPQTDANLNSALRRITEQYNRDAAQRGCPQEILPHFTCHILRHTFATRLCELGVNIKVVQEAMGHADAAMTLNTYVDVKEELRAQEMELFAALIPSAELDEG